MDLRSRRGPPMVNGTDLRMARNGWLFWPYAVSPFGNSAGYRMYSDSGNWKEICNLLPTIFEIFE